MDQMCLDRQYFGRVVTNMFFEGQILIKVEAQVSLVYVGLESRGTDY